MTDGRAPSSLRALLEHVLLHRRLIGYTTIAVLAAAVVPAVTRARTYTAGAAFMSPARPTQAGLNALVAQLGIGTAEVASESPQFYVDFISLQSTLRALVDSSYPASRGRRYRNLVEYFGASGPTYAVQRDRAVAKLRRRLEASADVKTGVVSVIATTHDPELSRALAERTIALVSDFNLQHRKSQAAAERDFVKDRLADALGELHAAEDRQEEFLQQNAVVASPRLRLEMDRLSQDVGTRRAVYTTLSQAYEQARIDAVRDTPLISVVEPPVVPAEPDSRGLARAAISGLFGGLVLGVLLAYWRTRWTLGAPP